MGQLCQRENDEKKSGNRNNKKRNPKIKNCHSLSWRHLVKILDDFSDSLSLSLLGIVTAVGDVLFQCAGELDFFKENYSRVQDYTLKE